jgi:MFS family permease
MITATYLIAAALAVVLGILFAGGHLGKFGFMAILIALFFFASAGASSAYLTVSEIFPMETRALAIAFFFAVGTAAGGIAGPLLFGHLINTGDAGQVALGFYIGAAVMAIGGIAELLFGVEAAQKPLEEVAAPLTAREADEGGEAPEGAPAEREGKAEEEEVVPAAAPAVQGAGRRRGRYRPGPGRRLASRGMMVSAPVEDEPLDTEVGIIARALAEHGETDRRELARVVGARYWGPGRFSTALRTAIEQGEAQAVSRNRIAPPLARSTS